MHQPNVRPVYGYCRNCGYKVVGYRNVARTQIVKTTAITVERAYRYAMSGKSLKLSSTGQWQTDIRTA